MQAHSYLPGTRLDQQHLTIAGPDAVAGPFRANPEVAEGGLVLGDGP